MSLKEEIDEARVKGSLELMYNTYAKQTIPEHAGEAQRKDTKRAFFAGALSTLQVLSIASESAMTEKEGAKFIHELNEETIEFFKGVSEGVN